MTETTMCIESHRRTSPVMAHLPAPMVAAIDAAAGLGGMSRSAALRELLVDALGRRGLWPPTTRETPDVR